VLFAGNVKPHKNLERLIRAFARVREQGGHEDLQLLLIGDDVSRYGALRRAVEATGLRQDVRFFGFQPRVGDLNLGFLEIGTHGGTACEQEASCDYGTAQCGDDHFNL
jgi:glycosyltransferase involved in cell wall biosynthesis